VAFESTASYLGRLAGAYRMGMAQLLDGLGIEPDGPGWRTGTGSAAPRVEIHLDTEARGRLAAFTRIPHDHLAHALPRLITASPDPPRPRRRAEATGPDNKATARTRTASARVRVLDTDEQGVRACPPCVRRRTRGAGDVAWTYPPEDRMWCPRHRYWASEPRLPSPLDTGGLPEIDLAYRAHRRLARGDDGVAAHIWAAAVTTRWYDRGRHMARRWQSRLGRLTADNPALTATSGVSAALLARPVVTYPETVALARALVALPRAVSRTPRGPAAYRHARALEHIADRLELPRLVVPPDDLLWARLHHHNPA